ncbi:hypothetical protein RUND412_004291 [Rhizina undulata]
MVERHAFDYATYTTLRDAEIHRGVPQGEWAASVPRYEWREYGDVAPRDEELEQVLFGDENYDEPSGTGIQFDKLFLLEVTIDSKERVILVNTDFRRETPTVCRVRPVRGGAGECGASGGREGEKESPAMGSSAMRSGASGSDTLGSGVLRSGALWSRSGELMGEFGS